MFKHDNKNRSYRANAAFAAKQLQWRAKHYKF